MHDSAALVLDEFDGDLQTVLTRPVAEAKRALMRFYGVGEPGAERILLLTRSQKVLPLDSNGARTMVRLGYGADDKNYTRMYRSVADAARPELAGRLRLADRRARLSAATTARSCARRRRRAARRAPSAPTAHTVAP